MILWYGVLLLFAFVSFLIDLDYLPQQILRHIWNILLVSASIYLLLRMRAKTRVGTMEKIKKEYDDLCCKAEESKFTGLLDRIKKLEERILSLEGNK